MIGRHRSTIALAGLLFAINVLAFQFLFLPGEALYRDSIEGGYASMARFFRDNPNPHGWNPEWYLGLPAQFTYLPGLPYLSALWMHLLPWLEPYHVYRLVATTFACLVPVSMFLFMVYFTGSRKWSFVVALAYTFCCPLYDLLGTLNRDRGFGYLPWRLQVLRKYGEGPHNMGLFFIPLVLVASWRAGRMHGFSPLFAAAALMAAVTLTNWVAALALAFSGVLLLLAAIGEPGFRHSRVIGAALLGYGLAAFWLTPTFVWTTAFNWPTDAFKYAMADKQKWLLCGLVAGVILVRLCAHFVARERRYLAFLLMSLFGFAWIVLWFYEGNIAVIPESRRYALEFELFFFLVCAELLRIGFSSSLTRDRILAGLVLLLFVRQDVSYLRRYYFQNFDRLKPVPVDSTIEYRLARKLAELKPQGRVYATGGLRFRLNSWYPFHQVGGGFESGLRNRQPIHMDYQIRTGVNKTPEEAGPYAVELLRAMGVEYAVVHGPKSKEHYRDVKHPDKFEGLLEPVHREEDDVIYRVPGTRQASLVRYNELIEWPSSSPVPLVEKYVKAGEDAARPALRVTWKNASEFVVEGPMLAGYILSLPVPYDEGWTAKQDGKLLDVKPDNFKFLMATPAGSPSSSITFRYRGTMEQRFMTLVSVCVWLWAIGGWISERRRARATSSIPTGPSSEHSLTAVRS